MELYRWLKLEEWRLSSSAQTAVAAILGSYPESLTVNLVHCWIIVLYEKEGKPPPKDHKEKRDMNVNRFIHMVDTL